MTRAPLEAAAVHHPLEEPTPLSRSILWSLQRRYFQASGIESWRRGTIPQYITTNPFIAESYARVLWGFLCDCAAAAEERGTPLDGAQRIHCVELGAGSGRFAHALLRRLTQHAERCGIGSPPFRYVMTDFVPTLIDYWRAHAALRPFVEAGLLDFAVFDAERDDALRLIESGELLSAETLRQPTAVIANYFFDGLPFDSFRRIDGRLHRAQVAACSSHAEPDVGDPELLARVQLAHDYVPWSGGDDPELDAIVLGYGERLRAELHFPVGAIAVCRRLVELARGGLLLLSGDRGYSSDAFLDTRTGNGFATHGSISVDVNYHAIGEYLRRHGASPLHVEQDRSSMVIAGFLVGEDPHPATRAAFSDALERFGPDDFFTIKKTLEQQFDAMTLRQVLALLRMSGDDPRIFMQCLPRLRRLVRGANRAEKRALQAALPRIWDMYFHLGEASDLPFGIGELFYELDRYDQALVFFHRSRALYGPHAQTAFNLALCHRYRGELEQALEWVDQALALDPDHRRAAALREELEGLRG